MVRSNSTTKTTETSKFCSRGKRLRLCQRRKNEKKSMKAQLLLLRSSIFSSLRKHSLLPRWSCVVRSARGIYLLNFPGWMFMFFITAPLPFSSFGFKLKFMVVYVFPQRGGCGRFLPMPVLHEPTGWRAWTNNKCVKRLPNSRRQTEGCPKNGTVIVSLLHCWAVM